jgi:serine/threonine-protein kinase
VDATLPPLAQSEERYSQHLQSIGVDAAGLSLASNGTVASISAEHTRQKATRPGHGAGAPSELELLPRMTLGEGDRGELGLLKTIGMGGMGKVMLALQRPLHREVAVKLPRTAAAHVNAELLREALVTGRLEHPNIVPVHLLGQNDDGAPFFVMKRIEGTPWRKLLDDPQALAALGQRAADPLRFHLGVLLEVCDAVSFAHSKGVLHRDLKPDNVMLGQFGEVYVLDWGIAVTLKPDPHLTPARESTGVSGTPAYMAPEMAAGDGARLSERTDVYLLGAVLHHVLAGRGPHSGGTLLATLTQAWESKPPQFSASVPDELANICRKALAREASERFASVQALRDAVEGFLRRRDSLALAAEGERRVSALEHAVAQAAARRAAPPAPSGRGNERSGEVASAALDAEALHAMFTESRFAFQQVRAVPGLEAVAKSGLHRALVAIARAELAAENLAAARRPRRRARSAEDEAAGAEGARGEAGAARAGRRHRPRQGRARAGGVQRGDGVLAGDAGHRGVAAARADGVRLPRGGGRHVALRRGHAGRRGVAALTDAHQRRAAKAAAGEPAGALELRALLVGRVGVERAFPRGGVALHVPRRVHVGRGERAVRLARLAGGRGVLRGRPGERALAGAAVRGLRGSDLPRLRRPRPHLAQGEGALSASRK